MLIGIKEKDKVVLAFSSFDGYYPTTVDDMMRKDNVGIWKVGNNPHTIMGHGFISAESDAFRYEEHVFQGEINYDRLLHEIVPAMEEFVKEREYIGNEDKNRFDNFLIAQNGRFFNVTPEHIVFEIDTHIVIADSMVEDEAKSVLSATEGEPALDRIRKAFEFAAGTRQYDCYPIAVMDTATRKIRIITGKQKRKTR